MRDRAPEQLCTASCPSGFASDLRSPVTVVRSHTFPEVIIVMRCIISLVLILVVSVAGAQNKPTADKVQPPRITAESGKQTYMHYCASCHGVSAMGDGPAASMLKTRPSDLTTLAKRHGGQFPHDYISSVLLFGTRIMSHGSSDMPIWGPIFASMDNYDEVAVRKRIKDLSDYLMSLQQKDS
jgi:mono/diheme cytochrome c family protein